MPTVLLRAPNISFPPPWDFEWRLMLVRQKISFSNPLLFKRTADQMEECLFQDQLARAVQCLTDDVRQSGIRWPYYD